MTIEIKQLVIRAIVEQSAEPTQLLPQRPLTATPPPARDARAQQREALDREALIADCARLVLRELRKERER